MRFFLILKQLFLGISNSIEFIYKDGEVYPVKKSEKYFLEHESGSVMLDENKNIIGESCDKDLVYYNKISN